MANPKAPARRRFSIEALEPEICALFEALCEIEGLDKQSLFKSLLASGIQRVLESRARAIDYSPETIEYLENNIDVLFAGARGVGRHE